MKRFLWAVASMLIMASSALAADPKPAPAPPPPTVEQLQQNLANAVALIKAYRAQVQDNADVMAQQQATISQLIAKLNAIPSPSATPPTPPKPPAK